MQGEEAESDQLAAPVFANFFGGGDPPDEAELTEAIRDEIARASAVAAEAAVSAATPAPATQPIVLMTPNPALTPVPSQAQGQMTPVVRSSLQALRESRPQSGGVSPLLFLLFLLRQMLRAPTRSAASLSA